ncbi:unnamed protein product [Somion occarium]|uniref:Uncharacterized protein n=1 Tax=Somion occarium TaxID=3059160 RepID=A0ABP1E799_9APHY
MAGDHKCPVCNSTFTRPQHVARHMRSHTGDRPYKCQHCGDQFARSDLLSRHVNKCHASEKPPTTTAPNNRRKGPTAASRATTSKQACDQCVQGSLPCDGCNPCSKCVQRKYRCTYVKFHRQTAPQGPGHPPPSALPPHHPHAHHHANANARNPSLPSGLGSTSLLGGVRPDDFLLAPPPGAALSDLSGMSMNGINVNGMSLYPGSLAGMGLSSGMEYPGYPGYAPSHATDQRQSPTPSLSLSASTSTRDSSLDGSPDMLAARYRAEQMLRSGQVSLPGISSIAGAGAGSAYPAGNTTYPPPSTTAGGLTGLYDSNPGGAWPSQSQQQPFQATDATHKDYTAGGRLSFPANPSTHQSLNGSNGHAGGYTGYAPHSQSQGPAGAQYSFRDSQQDRHYTRAGSEDSVSGRRPSTAPSVDMGVDEYGNGRPHTSHAYPGSSSPSHQQSQDARRQAQAQEYFANARRGSLPVDGEGGFSSAFGLMSLDDPAVLAGLQSDGAPFFSNVPTQGHSQHTNPSDMNDDQGRSQRSSFSSTTSYTGSGVTSGMGGLSQNNRPLSQPHQHNNTNNNNNNNGSLPFPSMSTPLSSKEELKEFWRQYLKTPLTGPGTGSGTGITPLFGPPGSGGLITPTASGDHLQLGAGGSGSGGGNNVGVFGRPQLSPTRRHSRVASLPSLKTPTIAMNEWLSNPNGVLPAALNSSQQVLQQQQHSQSQQAQQQSQQAGQQPQHMPNGGIFGGIFGGVPPAFNLTLSRDSMRKGKLPDPHAPTQVSKQQQQKPVSQQTHIERHISQNDNNAQDDLDSYKQAVMARQAPTTLHLVPRKRGKTIHGGALMGGTGSKDLVQGTDMSVSPPNPHPPPLPPGPLGGSTNLGVGSSLGGGDSGPMVRPGSSSSLADALQEGISTGTGGGRDSPTPGVNKHHAFLQPPPPPFHLQRQLSSSHSNYAPHPQQQQQQQQQQGLEHDYTNSGAPPSHPSISPYRPSFKRLASQTLGPENPKRALLGPAGWDDHDHDDGDGDLGSEEDEGSLPGSLRGDSRGVSEGADGSGQREVELGGSGSAIASESTKGRVHVVATGAQ